ncbi:hypothetical protein OUZ56_025264 [Daphnia magna]|uniref:Uncharacterized protein n=1 Tax=Daphnia magna TaxID=35525 RepID=A0ABQ9ZJB4_9CRUS|nr:hypothetical protein OUZ56_025264 [Daphnia magna]
MDTDSSILRSHNEEAARSRANIVPSSREPAGSTASCCTKIIRQAYYNIGRRVFFFILPCFLCLHPEDDPTRFVVDGPSHNGRLFGLGCCVDIIIINETPAAAECRFLC